MLVTVTSKGWLCLLSTLTLLLAACGEEASQAPEKGCSPGELKCVGTDVWKCSQSADRFELEQTCIGGTACVQGVCAAVELIPDIVPDVGPQCVAGECEDQFGKAPACRLWTCKEDHCFLDNVVNGAACSDANACTTKDNCQAGACFGTAVACDDAVDCTTDGCDPGSGCLHEPDHALCQDKMCQTGTCQADGCFYKATSPGVECSDGNHCTSGDACDGKGSCMGGEYTGDKECGSAADCVEGWDFCLGAPLCTAIGCDTLCVAQPGTAVTCAQDTEAPCMHIACIPESGSCQEVPLEDGTPCDDGDPCTDADICSDGECVAGAYLCNSCIADADCEDAEDFDLCNGTLICDLSDFPDTKCVVDPATVVHCDASQDTPCSKNGCNQATGQCEPADLPEDAPCIGPQACWGDWTCDGAGQCTAEPVDCDDVNPCTDDICDALSGDCVNLPDDANNCEGPVPALPHQCLAGDCVPVP